MLYAKEGYMIKKKPLILSLNHSNKGKILLNRKEELALLNNEPQPYFIVILKRDPLSTAGQTASQPIFPMQACFPRTIWGF